VLAIDNISKSFGAQQVLDNLSLAVQQSALTAIIGPNGCGKSTLFDLITGELRPDAGSIRFADKVLTRLKPRQIAQLGILRKFQIPGIFSELSVQEHLHLPFFINKKRPQQRLINEIAKQMNLSSLTNKTAALLSAGQKQWLEMAMLVLASPVLLLLDEPVAGMTASESTKTMHMLQALSADGLTIVVIDHQLDFVKGLTDDIVVILDGKVMQRGDYDTIAADKILTRRYLGTLYDG